MLVPIQGAVFYNKCRLFPLHLLRLLSDAAKQAVLFEFRSEADWFLAGPQSGSQPRGEGLVPGLQYHSPLHKTTATRTLWMV